MTVLSEDNNSRLIDSRTLYVGQGVSINGNISAFHVAVVDGVVEGNVSASVVFVGPSGTIKGNIVANEAEIYGTILATVEVKRLIIRATARVFSDISYEELLLEKGAIMRGALSYISSQFINQNKPTLAPAAIALKANR